MPIIIFLFFSLLVSCATNREWHNPPDAPRAKLTEENKIAKGCRVVGIFDSVGVDRETAVDNLQVRVAEEGSTHLVLTKEAPFNQNIPSSVDYWNNASHAKVGKRNVAVSGKGYSCK